MSGASGKQPAPTALLALMIAIEGLEAPEKVFKAVMSIQAAILDANPRSALSKRCCRLREAQPGVFRDVWRWLRTPEVLRAAKRSGAHWAWRVWCRACAAIDRGVMPHVAFGMNRPGRPAYNGMSHTDDVYLLADELHQRYGIPTERAGQMAADAIGVTMGDRRTMQRGMAKYRGSTADKLTARGVLGDLRLKYPRLRRFRIPGGQE